MGDFRFKLIQGSHPAGGSSDSGGVDIKALTRCAASRGGLGGIAGGSAAAANADGAKSLTAEEGYHYIPLTLEQSSAAEVETNSKLAAGKVIRILQKMEHQGYCGVETSSVYGAAVALPQIARSAAWSGTITALAVRSYFFLFLNIGLQAFLLSMIGEEQLVMYPFAGQMHLCDFGASIKECPDAPNCRGPDGTVYTPSRLYAYDIWSTRVFVRETLKSLFPSRLDEISTAVDPGEYGLENYWCRCACIFIFMMAVVDDLRSTMILASVLYTTPNKAERWIRYERPQWQEKDKAKEIKNWSELDLVKFQVAGMPIVWKAVNFFIILVPKCALWLALVSSGVHYLMETADIVNNVVNAMALTFVLDVDEMIFSRLSTVVTKHIMSNLEDLPNFDVTEEETEGDEAVLERFEKEEIKERWCKFMVIFPKRLMVIIAMQVFFMWTYYKRNCVATADGSTVSKDMYLPKDLTYRPLALMFGIESSSEEASFWTMPGE